MKKWIRMMVMLQIWMAREAFAEGPEDWPDPATTDEFAVIGVGKSNELFFEAAIDARIKGMLSRMKGMPVVMTPAVQEIVVKNNGRSGGGDAPTVNICSPDVADGGIRQINNLCLTQDVVVKVDR